MFSKSQLVYLAIMIGCVVPIGMSALLPRHREEGFDERQRQKRNRLSSAELQVQNLTRGLAVVSIEKHVDQDVLKVVLRNDYLKIITAYKVAVGSGTIATETIPEQEPDNFVPFRPGEMREEMYPLQTDVDTLGIKILAVLFDDKTSDGVPQYVREIQEYRLGEKLGIEQALKLLDGIAESSEAEIPLMLRKVQAHLSAHSEDEEKPLPHFAKVGFHDARARIVGNLNLMQNQSALEEQAKTGSEKRGRDSTTAIVHRLAVAASKL